MQNKTFTSDNNRANEGNQSTRHHHPRTKSSEENTDKQPDPQLNLPSPAHEYYQEFDHTGKGVNPYRQVKRH